MTYTFKVPDMSCNHCKNHIETALKDWGKADSWQLDLSTKTLIVESAESAEAISRVIGDVGYSPSLV